MKKAYPSIREWFIDSAPTYRSRSWRNVVVTFGWNSEIPKFMRTVSDRRCEKRIATYLIPGELERSRGSIRFGVKKEGHGFHAERGDFCLIGAAVDKRNLTVFYRRLELIGGLHYDTAVFQKLVDHFDISRVTIMAPEVKIYALRGNSNEKLYQQLIKFYGSFK